jgi:cell division protein FtsQ
MKKIMYLLFLVPLCLLSVLTGVYLFSRAEPVFLLQNIKIKGAGQLTESEILGRIYPFLRESIFRTDMGKVKETIVSHPFVKEVRVKRVFPFSILIDVKERIPSAMWVGATGDILMLDEEGQPYRPLARENTKDVFVVNARDKQDAKSAFTHVNAWMQEGIVMKDAISEVSYTDGSITVFTLQEGVEIILGKEEQKARLKRAVAVLEDAKKRGLLIKCIDARFEKGAIIKERMG